MKPMLEGFLFSDGSINLKATLGKTISAWGSFYHNFVYNYNGGNFVQLKNS